MASADRYRGSGGRAPVGARVREEAARILDAVEHRGAYASALLDRAEPRFRDPRDRALLHEIVLGVCRRRPALDRAIERAAERSIERLDSDVRIVLRIASYSIFYLDRVPAHAAVSLAVDAARNRRGRGAAGFVNAVMRRLVREAEVLGPRSVGDEGVAGLALRHGLPVWWVERIVDRYGEPHGAALCAAQDRPAPTFARVATDRASVEEVAVRLRSAGVEVSPGRFDPRALRLSGGSPALHAAHDEGLFYIQDEASQLVSRLSTPEPGALVYDACAAPGGKALDAARHVGERGLVVACDHSRRRLADLLENAARLRLEHRVRAMVADATHPPVVADGTADVVIVDAPCTGTGTLRRHPEIRYRLVPGDPERMARLQLGILASASRAVRRGGRLVYSVCSLEPEEGEEVVEAFLGAHAGFARADARDRLPSAARVLVGADGALRTSPTQGELDGFFAAVLSRVR